MPRPLLLEVCVASVEDAVAAERGGAGRLELNAALTLGGLTPSLGCLLEVKQAVRLPVMVMVRPRPGGFCYSAAEFRVLCRDAELALNHGADGLVFGVLHPDGRIDLDRCRTLVRLAGSKESVFHRAFDVTPDPAEALEQLIDLGARRVLTSGQEETAYNGAGLIAGLVRQAAGRIQVLPGGGVNRFTLADVIRRTGCDQVHASLRGVLLDRSTSGRPQVAFRASVRPAEETYDATAQEAVADLCHRLHSFSADSDD